MTILNSRAINAFALPTGQLYVTRGLLALANDTSELASVLSHEMAHVIAKPRRDPRRPGAPGRLVSRVATDVLQRSATSARWRSPRSKLALASFSRAQEFEADGIGVGISARAGFDPYGAVRFLTAMERNAELKAGKTRRRSARRDFLSSHPATPERVQNAQANARQYAAPGSGERDRETYLAAHRRHGLRRGPERRLRARPPLPASQARLHVHRAGKLHARQYRAGGARRARRRRPGAALRRGAGAGRADAADYLNSGWIENVDKANRSRNSPSTASRPPPRPRKGDQWAFRLYAMRFGSDVYRFIFAAKQMTTESERNARETVNTFRRLTLEEIQAARPLRIKVITVSLATPWNRCRAAWPASTARSNASACSTASMPTRRSRPAIA